MTYYSHSKTNNVKIDLKSRIYYIKMVFI